MAGNPPTERKAAVRLLTVSRMLHAPIDEVWAITSSFGAVGTWIPGVSRVTLRGYGVGAVRHVTAAFGVVEEQMTLIDPDQHRIRYTAKAAGMEMLKDCVGGIDLIALGDGATRVDWVLEAAHEVDLQGADAFMSTFFADGIVGLAAMLGAELD
jgi:carbon monoxide dehydrogenase subunit G